ncbi:MAG: hypothetical protein RJB13_2168 [Pseudomonadota bacterium]
MRRVERKQVLSLDKYESFREEFRQSAMAAKALRRVHVGEHLTFLFENHETTLYQIQEMLRAEKTTDEAHIVHEIETYNEILGEQGELGCTLLIEIDDPQKRDNLLRQWLKLPEFIYVKTQSGSKVRPQFDERQVGEHRISSVHYMRFRLGDQIPVGVGCDLPDLALESALTTQQISAFCKDILAR